MEISTNYIKEVSKVNKSNAISAYNQTEEKRIDYSTYIAKEIRDIPYSEAKENYEQIKERISVLIKDNVSESKMTEGVGASFQLTKVNHSSNDKLNEAMYNTMQNFTDTARIVKFDYELQTNLEDFYHRKDTTASFQINGTDGSNHANKNLTREQLSSINLDDFISKMLKTFTEDYSNAKSQSAKEQYKELVDGYSKFKENYEKAVTEPYYA